MGGAAPAKPRRASKRQIRAWAWIAGTLSFFAPWAMLGLSPRPAANAAPAAPRAATPRQRRPVVVVITKKIIVGAASSAPTTTSTSAPINYVYAPAPAAPAPATVSCGTHPC